MADWTELDTNGLLPGEPLTSAKALAFFENPVAMAEGAVNAPRVYGLAMAPDDQIVTDGLVLTVTAADTHEVVIGFSTAIGTLSNGSTSFVTAYTITASGGVVGTIRFKASHRTTDVSRGSTLRVLKNSVVVTTFATTNSLTPVERSADIAIAAGDVITWQHRISVSGGDSVVSLPRQSASDAYFRIGALIKGTDL